MERERLPRDEPEGREAPRQLLECELRLELSERSTEAVVDALAEGEVLRRIRAVEAELIGIGERAGVPICGREPQVELRALAQLDTGKARGPRRQPPPHRHRRVEAKRLL